MKKNIIFISVFVIVVIIAIVGFFVIKRNNTKFDYELENVTSIDYMLINENNKFGVINRNGDVVVSPIYDEIDIPNPSKPLFICMYNYNEEKQQYNIKVLNEKSEQILYQYVVVEAIKINSAVSEIPYEKSVLKYKQNGKYGLIDFNGNIIVKAKYEEIQGLDYKEGLLLVKNNGKYGVININGVTLIKEEYDIIQSDGYYEEGIEYGKSGFIVGKRTEDGYKYGYINFIGKKLLDNKYNQIERVQNVYKNDDVYLVAFENGRAGFYNNKKKIIEHDYEDIVYDMNNNCLILQRNFKQGISDLNGNVIIDVQYDNIFISGKYINAQENGNADIYDYTTGQKVNIENALGLTQTLNDNYTIVITIDEKYKILDNYKTEVKEQEYDYLEYMYDDYFIANINQKYGIVDINGNEIIDFKYDFMQKIGDTKIVQGLIADKNQTDLIVQDKLITSMKKADIYLNENYINIQSDSDSKYIGSNGNILENTKILNKPLYAIEKNEKWGFSNKSGEIVIETKYDFVTEFNEYGFAGIKLDGKWGSINLDGEIVIEPTYKINYNNPNFVGKYYEFSLGYGQPYYICENIE